MIHLRHSFVRGGRLRIPFVLSAIDLVSPGRQSGAAAISEITLLFIALFLR